MFDPAEFPKTYSAKSTVPGAALGLFAAEIIAPGKTIVEYTGRNLTLAQAKVLKNRMYLKAASFNHHIDGSVDYASKAKFINDHIDKSKHNVKFVTVAGKDGSKKKRVFVQASREIKEGEELFVDYGRGHWLFHPLPEFLDLEVVDSPDGKLQQLRATSRLDKGEVIAVYSSQLLDEHFHVFGKLVTFTPVKAIINTTLRKNPFIPNTVMLSALRQIEPGEVIAASGENQLIVKPSSIIGGGLGAFARCDIPAGSVIGEYTGNILTMLGFRRKLASAPAASGYAFSFVALSDEGKEMRMIIDPTNDEGKVDVKKNSAVCFINEFSENADDNNARFVHRTKMEENLKKELDGIVYVVAKREIKQGNEVFVHYGEHFSRNWKEQPSTTTS